ncbi:MAG: transcriptional regulator [Planctomycetes bacterium]|nr:transcriptional regulator [Planctomycetota bacterium]
MLGTELQKARKAAGLSQEELGFRAGVHRTYVSMLERGKASPTVDTLFQLCKALRIKASDFIRRVEKSNERPARR